MQKIALYGLGTETEKAISELHNHYDIVGLLDGFRDSGKLYGKNILSLEQVVAFEVSQIIVVARPGSCKAITKRIGAFCRENAIALFDIRGKDLLQEKRISYDFKDISGYTKKDLMDQIKLADVVSFDLFDTLIMRCVFSYTDIFELVDSSIRERGILIPDFSECRLQAEKELSKDGAPMLEDIYERVISDKALACELANLEYETDKKTIGIRRDMVDIFDKLVKLGKNVFITTDTYYSKNQIIAILDGLGIVGYRDVLVSCEYHKGKRQGLFEVLKSRVNDKYIYYIKNNQYSHTYDEYLDENYFDFEKKNSENDDHEIISAYSPRILHIGDDQVSDIEAAECAGIESFKIYSAVELFDAVGGLGLEAVMTSLSDRIKVGMLNAALFNSPFQFETVDRRMTLSGAGEVGYVVCAPIVCDFMFWFRDRVKKRGIRNVWFSARDGYLIKKLYEILGEDNSIYFLTSRIAAIRAGVENVKDISYVDSMRFFGTAKENLKVRFGIESAGKSGEDAGSDAVVSMKNLKKAGGLIDYTCQILEKSKTQKKNCLKYVDSLNIHDGDIAFFDFVAKGTTQMYVQRLTTHHLKGFYFLQLEPVFMKDKGVDIEPFYSQDEKDASEIFDNYYILETLLTAPHPQVLEFDENGEPVYAQELRSAEDMKCFEEMQQGVMDYFRDYLSLISEKEHCENKMLDEKILSLIHGLAISNKAFLSLTVEDPFFNRMTDLKDLI